MRGLRRLACALDVGPSSRGQAGSETRMTGQSRELKVPCTPLLATSSGHVQLSPNRAWLPASAATIAPTGYPRELLRLLPRDECFPDRNARIAQVTCVQSWDHSRERTTIHHSGTHPGRGRKTDGIGPPE